MSGRNLLVLAACVVMLAACRDTTLPAQEQPCIEGRTRACDCVDTTEGFQACGFDGTWSLCICGSVGAAGTTGAAGSGTAGAGTGTGGAGMRMGPGNRQDGSRPSP